MDYHDELLRQSLELIAKPSPTQADLRRAVSAAYYALFHLLITETVMNWTLDSSRGALARMFDHALMKKVSRRVLDPQYAPFAGADQKTVKKLREVARTYIRLQEQRHVADYDNTKWWTQSDATEEVAQVREAFTTWQAIRHHKIAQDYLVSLLIKPRD